MISQSLLARRTGVMVGTYTHLRPDGALIDHYASRQETRMEGDNWYERIIYRWADGREQTLDFRAKFAGEGDMKRMVFEDPDFHGESFQVSADIYVFPYFWKSSPETKTVEIITYSDETRRSRVWQKFERGELVQITVIVETLAVGETPAVWY
jgi:hypothetical protein